jgi:broad specificity phosphatase PhoE
MAKRLILIRHGQVEERFAGRFVGATDAALSPAGLRQAQDLAAWLAGKKPEACFCSPLKRCVATAHAALAGLPLHPELDPDLREVDFGAWEGLSFADIAGKDAAAVDRWARFEPGFRFPDGESIADFTTRIAAAAARLAAAPPETVVAFTHGGVIRFMLCALLRLDPRSYAAFEIRPAGVAELALFEGGALLQHLGDVCAPARQNTGGER